MLFVMSVSVVIISLQNVLEQVPSIRQPILYLVFIVFCFVDTQHMFRDPDPLRHIICLGSTLS